MKASSSAIAVAVLVVVAACSGCARVAEATIESTCGAAARGDRRVDRCDGGLAKAGAKAPLPRYSADCQKMAIIGIAITGLLK
uniref:Uncharacterized protein n=1 Tax=Oryza brachyantha TaxID=4533 RepID=J3M3Z6_ORYBR